ncbi:MAG: hypothetical protein WDN49_27430 [Acetobacteraceae bacterium]
MFANRFTAFNGCVRSRRSVETKLAAYTRGAEFFRLRWSAEVLGETERAIADILDKKGALDALERAAKARQSMEAAFEDALVSDYDSLRCRLCRSGIGSR